MATPTIPNGEAQFFPLIYEGNGGGQRVGRFVSFTNNGTVANSCLFKHATNNYLSRTPSSAGSTTKATFSCWIKRDATSLGSTTYIMLTNDFSANGEVLQFDSSNRLQYYCLASSSYRWNYISNRTFEDTSKWYHLYVRRDTTNGTAGDRIQIYVDGVKITSWNTETQSGSSSAGFWNQTTYANIVGNSGNGSYIDGAGYLAEVNMVDGSNPAVSTFGLTDTSTNRWIAKSLTGITYGTNGFRLTFADASALGDDTSGGGNDLASTNLTSANQYTDSPTQNHCTWDVGDKINLAAVSLGNTKITGGSASTSGACRGTLAPKSGKYYFEFKFLGLAVAGHNSLGIRNKDVPINSTTSGSGTQKEAYHWRDDGYVITGSQGSMNSGFSTYTTNDYIGVAMDLDTGKVWMSKNGTYEKSGNPVTGANPMFTIPTRQPYTAWWNGYGYTNNTELNCGQKAFNTSAPTGFSALQQDNLPTTDKGISGLVWIKDRDATKNHNLFDSSRGIQKELRSNSTDEQFTNTDTLNRFLVGGCQIEDGTSVNNSGDSFVSWNWVANGGTTASNSVGSITTTTQVNSTSGFSIVEYTGTGSNATVGHGLSSAPEWVMQKSTSNNTGDGFAMYHVGMTSASYYMDLSNTNAEANAATVYQATAPTSSVVSIGTAGGINTNTYTYVMYCFHSVDGYSKFGKYGGNGSTDGPFIYTGFKPAWLMTKRSDSANDWQIFDATRNPFNPVDRRLYANLTNVEAVGSTSDIFDFTANGFKVREDNAAINTSGGTYIYMAFAEHPFVGDGTNPVTAR